ncbi:LEM domain-containing protein 1 isoform X2 [Nannospalax galili]|nr:LEM domain-containing protein 1 isoform X2 [Nannospalax galili]
MYEKKLVELLVSPPCKRPVTSRHRESDEAEDSDKSEELNIILKGNIGLSAEKGKEFKKRPEASTSKGRPLDTHCLNQKPTKGTRWCCTCTEGDRTCYDAPATCSAPQWGPENHKIRGPDFFSTQRFTGRCAARLGARTKPGCVTKEKDYCVGSQSPESRFPWSLKLAVLGIFIIVLFVYITVEKKPLFR